MASMINGCKYIAAAGVTIALMVGHTAAFASDTTVECFDPLLQIGTGADGNDPRATVFCAGQAVVNGSPQAIQYFSYSYATNPIVAQSIAEEVESFRIWNPKYVNGGNAGKSAPMVIHSDFSKAGVPRGCGSANCRFIDYIEPYDTLSP